MRTNYLIDVQFGVIVDVEASRAVRQAEVGAARTMLERTEERFGLKPQRLAADSAYGSAPMLNWLVEEKRITPHIPVIDKSKREDGTFSREDFRYDEATDTYVCPSGKTLTTRGTLVNDGITLLYRGSTRDCVPCPLKAQCCPKTPARRIPRSIYERARDVATISEIGIPLAQDEGVTIVARNRVPEKRGLLAEMFRRIESPIRIFGDVAIEGRNGP
jgi:hypothetical protein